MTLDEVIEICRRAIQLPSNAYEVVQRGGEFEIAMRRGKDESIFTLTSSGIEQLRSDSPLTRCINDEFSWFNRQFTGGGEA